MVFDNISVHITYAGGFFIFDHTVWLYESFQRRAERETSRAVVEYLGHCEALNLY